MSDFPTYSEAIEEIDAIVEEIEGESVDLDVLSSKVQRAAELIKHCKSRLRKTDKEITGILKEFDAESEN
ncbi:MAG: exodeoxyribonuclease VII small subunit [Nitrospira sp.]|nr:exodeoxyribonuclease VII small subunit [bacterium]MBL7048796.1 exodeoxyribonuclease VII small subunit [Nitrospira sp.]